MYTISQLAKLCNLSRSTLLYYESIGLLEASDVTENNYRLYTEGDKSVLEKICMYKEMGIPLKKIKRLLTIQTAALHNELESQLLLINDKIKSLRTQQQAILNILQIKTLTKNTRLLSKEQWVGMFKTAGMTDKDMVNWHKEFEQNAPEAHQDFLESLGIGEDEIVEIRQWSSETI